MFGSAKIYGNNSSIRDAKIDNAKIGETDRETAKFTNVDAATVDVTGHVNAQNVTASHNVTARQNVDASNNVTAGTNVVAASNVEAGVDVKAGKNVEAIDDVKAGKNVEAGDDVTAGRDLTVENNATIRTDLTVENNATIDVDLTVKNNAWIHGVVTTKTVSSYNDAENQSGDMTIMSKPGSKVQVDTSECIINASHTTIKGNLTIEGTTETINSTEVTIADPITIQGKGNSSVNAPRDLGWLGETSQGKLAGLAVNGDSGSEMYFVKEIDEAASAGDSPDIVPTSSDKLASVHANNANLIGMIYAPQIQTADQNNTNVSVDGEQKLWLLKNHLQTNTSNDLVTINVSDGNKEGQMKSVMHVSNKESPSIPDPTFLSDPSNPHGHGAEGERKSNSFVLEFGLNQFAPPNELNDNDPIPVNSAGQEMSRNGYRLFLDEVGQSANLVWVSGKWFCVGANNCRIEYRYT